MNIKTKYWLEENRGKIAIIGAAVSTLAVIGGGIFMYVFDKSYDETAGPEVVLASNIISRNADGDLTALSLVKESVTDTLAIPKNAILFKGPNLDRVYVYDPTTFIIREVGVTDDHLHAEPVLEVAEALRKDINEATHILTNDKAFAFVTPKKTVVVDETGKRLVETSKEWANADAVQLTETDLYVSKQNKLLNTDLANKETAEIEIGDTTTDLTRNGNYLMAHNNFGSGKDVHTLLRINGENLYIEELKKVPASGQIQVAVPADENQLVYLQIRKDEKGNVERQDLLTMNAVGTKTEKNAAIDSAETTIALTTEGTYEEATTLASNGFLYNLDVAEGEITITEIRNGREAKAIAVETDEAHAFYVPIYKK